ncbi:MAG: RNA polymerase sigma factor [Bdellovibrionales bacterium]
MLVGLSEEDRLTLFKKLYDEQNRHVRKTIYWMVGPENTDDLVQETFYKAWKSFNGFKGNSSKKTWMHRLAVNVAIDHLRKKKLVLIENIPEEASAPDPVEVREIISMALANLSEKFRVCFVLYYKIGFTKEEISEIEEIPVGTVKSRLHTAKSQFIEYLKKHGVSYE